MSTSSKIVDFRTSYGLLPKELAKTCDISTALLHELEAGGVTHPSIAARIQHVCGLTDEETEELLPKCRRKNSGEYEPDKHASLKGEVYLSFGARQGYVNASKEV